MTDSIDINVMPIPFEHGTIVLTNGVNDLCKGDHSLLVEFLNRHLIFDWGCINEYDKSINNQATIDGGRIMSAYIVKERKIWIITDAGHKTTSLLLPSEY